MATTTKTKKNRVKAARSLVDVERHAFIGDIHVPYHDERALGLALDFISWWKPHRLYLIGDIIDFYQLSRYDKDPERLLGLQGEFDDTIQVLYRFRKAVGDKCRIIYKEGNHEFRLVKYLWAHPEIAGLKVMQLGSLLSFADLGIQEHYGYKDMLWLLPGKFLVEHGDMARKWSGYTARGMLEKRGVSGISGHTHRMGSNFLTNYGNGVHVWYENGCLCRLDPGFIHGLPNWQQGFSVGYVTPKRVDIHQVSIREGLIHYGEQIFSQNGR